MKRTLLLALLCLLPITAKAQVGPISITSAQCATIAVGNNVSTIAVNISGTWTGTLQPQVSIQGQSAANIQVTPSTSSTAQSTITANGVYTAAVAGYDTFLLCGNTVASGTAVINLNNSVARRGGSSGSGSSGTVTSVATTSPITGGTITGTGTVACATCAIGPGSSTANHLAKFSGTDGVTLADGGAIPAGTVTSVATTSPIGGGTITGTGTVTCTTCTTATTPTAHGVILGAGTQALGVTAVGTTGQVLTGVTGADPVWGAAASGALVQLEAKTASTSASLAFTTCLTNSSYHIFVVKLNQIVPTTNAVNIVLQMSTDGGSTYLASTNYAWGGFRQSSAGNAGAGSSGDPSIVLDASGAVSNSSSVGGGFSGSYELYNPAGGTNYTRLGGLSSYYDGSATIITMLSGMLKSTTAVNAFRIAPQVTGTVTGTLASGTATCYGVTP